MVPISPDPLSGQTPATVLLSLGSNIEPEQNLVAAVRLLAADLAIERVSKVYETAPAGGSEGPAFLNAAVQIRCDLGPGALKQEVLRPIEKRLGRVRTDDANAPRTIDLDISFYGQQVIHDSDAGLDIPDPDVLDRAHVAIPLADLAPGFSHPIVGRTLAEIAAPFAGRGVRVLEGLALWPQSDRF